jgi:ABC-type antimicrobial peptide transport system permease subunit
MAGMTRLIQYSKSALYHIMHNKVYSLFCIIGAAITFLFVSFLLQIGYMIGGNYPPAVYADHTVRLETFTDDKGENVGGISHAAIEPFLENIQEYEAFSVSNSKTDVLNVYINDQFFITMVGIVDAGFWDVYQFRFIAGRPFTRDDWDNRKMYAVITKELSKTHLNTVNSIGKKIILMGYELEVIGVVDDVSLLSSPTPGAQLWIPSSFAGLTNSSRVDILFPAKMDMSHAKEILSRAVIQEFNKKGVTVKADKNSFHTVKEEQLRTVGNSAKAGIGLMACLILLIPAVNIVTLNISYANNMADIIAIRRAFGAGRLSSFFQIMLESLFLIMTGTIIGVLLVKPIFSMIQDSLVGTSFTGGVSIITGIDFKVMLTAILPMMILFSVMSGGIPAYRTAKRNIADVLKGDVK